MTSKEEVEKLYTAMQEAKSIAETYKHLYEQAYVKYYAAKCDMYWGREFHEETNNEN